jgi:hypothetical protein
MAWSRSQFKRLDIKGNVWGANLRSHGARSGPVRHGSWSLRRPVYKNAGENPVDKVLAVRTASCNKKLEIPSFSVVRIVLVPIHVAVEPTWRNDKSAMRHAHPKVQRRLGRTPA